MTEPYPDPDPPEDEEQDLSDTEGDLQDSWAVDLSSDQDHPSAPDE